jgi:hypothetical protein
LAADPCQELAQTFWSLMNERRFGEAGQVLSRSRQCDFYQRGAFALQNEFNAECQRLDLQIRQACLQGNLALAQNLLQQARQRNCRVSAEATSCIQRRYDTERNQRDQQQLNQIMGVMTDIIRMQQQNQRPPTNSTNAPNRPPTLPPTGNRPNDPLNSAGYTMSGDIRVTPPGGGNSTGPGGGNGSAGGSASSSSGGRSREDCERQYCPMCFNDVDLLSFSVDPQCNQCRKVRAANISACMAGRSGGAVQALTGTYRLVCHKLSANSSGCYYFSCLGPQDVKKPNDVVVRGDYTSWDKCKADADSRNPR